jgi:hypothetical protein
LVTFWQLGQVQALRSGRGRVRVPAVRRVRREMVCVVMAASSGVRDRR